MSDATWGRIVASLAYQGKPTVKLATVLATASLIAIACGATAAGAATTYSDRATFEAQLAGHFTDDYENPGYHFFQNDAQMSAVVGQTTYTATGFGNVDLVPTDGGTGHYYCAGCNGSFQLGFGGTTYSSGGGVYGVGFDLFANQNYDALVTFANGSSTVFTLPTSPFTALNAFWGVTSDLGIASIYLGHSGQAATDGNTGIDNLEIGAKAGGAVPEPAAWALMIGGFGLAGTALRRRRAALA